MTLSVAICGNCSRHQAISGWIRNCPDGSVEAHIQGDDHAVSRMIDRMRRGPSNARVDDIEVEETEPQSPGRFELRR